MPEMQATTHCVFGIFLVLCGPKYESMVEQTTNRRITEWYFHAFLLFTHFRWTNEGARGRISLRTKKLEERKSIRAGRRIAAVNFLDYFLYA